MAEPETGVPAVGALGRPPVGVLCRSVPGRAATWLTSVAALASHDVWAGGDFAPARRLPEAPLIEHLNRRSLSLRPTHSLTPLKTVLPQNLASVAALPPDDVWVL